MTPVLCRVKHDPAAGTYGDCVRACIATIMDVDAEAVPHFVHDGCDGTTMQNRIRDWLAPQGLAPYWTHYDGNIPLEEVLETIGAQNPNVVYLLYGRNEGGNHVNVCCGDKIVHDPNWYRTAFRGCADWGAWSVMVITKL